VEDLFNRLVGPGDWVLDVGCGTGYFTRAMAEAVTFAGPAMGVDPSREAIARTRRLTRVANGAFSEGIAQALDAPDGSYDVVVSSLVVHHLPDTLRPPALREMVHVLRPGGQVLVADSRPPTSRIGRHLIGPFTSPLWRTTPSICSTGWFLRPASSRSAKAMCSRGSGTCGG